MKKMTDSLLLSLCLAVGLITIFSNCEPVKNILLLDVTYHGHDTMSFKAGSAAGTYSYSEKTIKNNIDSFMKRRGIDKSKIVNIRHDSTIITIPSNSTLDFSALDEGIFTMKGLTAATNGAVDSVSVKFPKSSGKVLKLVEPVIRDVRGLFLNFNNFQYAASLKTNRSTPATEIDVKFSFTISY